MSETAMHAQPVDVHEKPYNRTIMIVLILVATFAGVLMQTSLGTAIPTLMDAFDTNLATAPTGHNLVLVGQWNYDSGFRLISQVEFQRNGCI